MNNIRQYILESYYIRYIKSLEGLKAEARKYKTYIEFEKAYTIELKHGVYWHVTDDPNFKISELKGPRDMSSMGFAPMASGKLMITSDLSHWIHYYKDTRGFAAIIDMSNVNKKDYYQVNRGFGNEFFVRNPNKARVAATVTRRNALNLEKLYKNIQPDSREELKDLYNRVWGKT